MCLIVSNTEVKQFSIICKTLLVFFADFVFGCCTLLDSPNLVEPFTAAKWNVILTQATSLSSAKFQSIDKQKCLKSLVSDSIQTHNRLARRSVADWNLLVLVIVNCKFVICKFSLYYIGPRWELEEKVFQLSTFIYTLTLERIPS